MASSKTEFELHEFFDSLRAKIGRSLKSGEMRKLAGIARDLIKNRTRAGFGISGFGSNISRVKLKDLADSTIAQREYFKRLHPETSPDTSNLTLRGKLLDSMRITNQADGGATLGFTGNNTKLTNKQVAEYVQDVRPFFALTNSEKGILTKSFNNAFSRNLR